MTQPPSDLTNVLEQMRQERDVFKKQYLKVRNHYENKINELSILKELAYTLRSENLYEHNVFYHNQLKIIQKYTGLAFVSLMLVNEERWALSVVARSDMDGPVIQAELLPLDDGVPGRVINEKSTIVIISDENDDGFLESGGQGAMLYAPVIHNRESIGVLTLKRFERRGFDQNEIRFYNLVADQISTAVVLSRLYTKMIQEESRRSLLSRFFSKTVTEKILGGKETPKLGGERKYAAIIFADLHGFTNISESMDQESVVEILNAYFSEMTPIVFKHEGTLDKLMGDGMMAVFGAPISKDDDTLRAVRAVIEMDAALKRFNRRNSGRSWPELKMSVGINSGEVVAGYIGSEDHLNYTVIGDEVNIAQRLQSIAGPDEIYISKSVRDNIISRIDEIKGISQLVPMPKQKLKGKKKMIDVFRIEIDESVDSVS